MAAATPAAPVLPLEGTRRLPRRGGGAASRSLGGAAPRLTRGARGSAIGTRDIVTRMLEEVQYTYILARFYRTYHELEILISKLTFPDDPRYKGKSSKPTAARSEYKHRKR